MSEWLKIPLYFLASIALAALLAPFVIKIMAKLKAKQTVLGYVKQHEAKNGTPTMGGFIFLIPATIFPLIEFTPFSAVAVSVMLGFCILGFLDDFLKIRYARNLGLKPYQKIIGQLGISVAVGYFVYASGFIGGELVFPFGATLDIKWGIIIFTVLVYVATTNSVNLTDGLDGLAGYTSVAYFITFTLVLFFLWRDAESEGNAEYAKQLLSLTVYSASLLGGLLGYLVFNGYPAKIWMGDTGSLALGAGVASVAVFAKIPILIVVAGIMFVFSSISVILQVLSFKLTKKRVFLMAPFHHHLEMKGLKESKIVTIYFVVSMAAGALTLIFARA
ncbi:MAG: phospho-N-acetylmuramoyl-pentapeptide-transferase [Clostridia bacterium]|nr:phospho-N-acetylmuramoyl-pentapeptide-transferase [Clostridia bacterium]